MSKFTTEVRYICETADGLSESQSYKRVDDILKSVHEKIFDFKYPIFDVRYKTTLECNILRHYYTREICAETVGLWKLWLDARMNEIMPYYNELYKSTLIEFNPLWDVDYTKSGNRTVDGTKKNTGTVGDIGNTQKGGSDVKTIITDDDGTITTRDTGTITDAKSGTLDTKKTGTETAAKTGTVNEAKTGTEADAKSGYDTDANVPKNVRWDLYSDTPQGGINGIEGDANGNGTHEIGENYYLTNARKIIDDGTGSMDTTTFNSTVTTTHNTNDLTTHNTQDQTTFNTDVLVTDNRSNTRTLNTTDTKTIDTTKDTTETINYGESVDTSNTRTLNTQEKNDNLTEYLETISGKRGDKSFSEMILEYRKTFLNIDKMIIDELSDLFFNLWE